MLRYYNVWADQRRVPRDFLLVATRLHADTGAKCAGSPRSLASRRHRRDDRASVEHGSFGSMKKRERRGRRRHSARGGPRGDPESFKTRRGKIAVRGLPFGGRRRLLNGRIDAELDPFYGYSSQRCRGRLHDDRSTWSPTSTS